jgi:cytidylate kinase
LIVAIDGPAGSGKGTVGKRLAADFDLAYLDTGALYRRTGVLVLRGGGDPGDEAAAVAAAKRVGEVEIPDAELRTEPAADAASRVAAMQPVRDALLDFQRDFAARPPGEAPGAILDGRDIGTVVCPDADLKLFITASAEERADRRWRDLVDAGMIVSYDEVLDLVKDRDARDERRAAAPLKPADDAHLLDTTDLSIEAAVEAASELVRQALAQNGS